MKIFLADDDADDREFFCDALEESSDKISATCFENGVELMAGLFDDKDDLPDLIFLDLNMPMMNGFECLSDILEIDYLAAIPVIIYSTSFHPDDVHKLQQMGAYRYLQKPSTFKELSLLLDKCFKELDLAFNAVKFSISI